MTRVFLRAALCLLTCTNGIAGLLRERYDGWYNNLANPEWGAAGDDVIYDVPPAYSDLTYLPAGEGRPNPRLVSNVLFAGQSGLPSWNNKTALFAFFGQMIAYEIVHATDSACPVELIRVPVPSQDAAFNLTRDQGQQYMPFTRSAYNSHTGQAPNNPRRPINKVSSYIDGSHIYGRGELWCNCLRSFVGGQLTSQGELHRFPGLNTIRLPMDMYPSARTHDFNKLEEQWMFGDPHAHQNPGLTVMAVVWFRFHNAVARRIQADNPDWTDEKVFAAARKRVVATLQNIIFYEWLPALLGSDMPPYEGYKPSVRPSIGAVFEAAAFRMGHSFIPPGFYVRDKKCNFKKKGTPIRLCNSYWSSQEILNDVGLEGLVMGMTSQIMEREDHVMVEDLRSATFGPLHYSRHDLAMLSIMRGRDHGLPDYNTARQALGLPRIKKWKDINPWLYDNDRSVLDRLRETYMSLEKLDVYTAGVLESSPSGPGPLFSKVIRDQFDRIRRGDRYWFENELSGLFTPEERSEIRNTTLRDVILEATDLDPEDLPQNVFFWKQGDPCPQPAQLTESDMEPCTPHQGYDYFKGSEVAYILAFTCLALLPFVCILVAYLVAKYKKKQQQISQSKGNTRKPSETSIRLEGVFTANEWTGAQSHPREVHLELDPRTCVLTVSAGRKVLRTIKLQRQDSLDIWLSNDKWRDVLLIHVIKEYDLVLMFHTEAARREFLSSLTSILKAHSTSSHLHELPHRDILARAITKTRRQDLITQVFKNIFMEAHTVNEALNADGMEAKQCKEIVECELTREEFAEALALKPDSLFVDQMFGIIDRDGNGYVSFRELLNAVMLFAKGSCEDKLQLLFTMYDQDKSGSLDRQEVAEMIRSMMEMANANLCPEETNRLVDEMFVTAGMAGSASLQLADFNKVLAGHMHMLWDVCIDWKGTKVRFPKKKQKKKKGDSMPASPSSAAPTFDDAIVKNPLHPTWTAMRIRMIQHYLENHRRHIIYMILFFAICALIFAERFYYFAVEQEHRGFRRLMGHGLCVTRGAAGVMSFTFSLLLLTMCRNTITKLRETVLNFYVPFDSNVAFHKVVAYTALAFTTLHIVGYCFNFYHIVTQPVNYLCVLDEVFFRSDFQPKITFWLFQNLTGVTGVLLVIVICIIYIFASQTARTHIFSAFWATHQLFYALYILTLLHGCLRLVQEPYFPFYFIPPAIIFTVDKMVSMSKKKRALSVIKAEILPSDVTMLEFKRPTSLDYRSGQWVRIACEELGTDEYHAMTLTSAPHEENLSVHIRGVGPWTRNIHKIYDPANLRDKPYPKLYIDGPFGAGQQDWCRYDVSVLVGGGIGITPYASILKDFVFMTSVKNTFRLRCQKVYFMWVTSSQKHFEWMVDILRQVESVDERSVVDTHIFITQFFQRFDLRTTMLYICEEHFQRMSGRSMFSGLKAKTHFGRPDFDKVLDAVRARHPKTRKIGVFSCGPPGLTKGVQQACYSSTKRGKARFEHHFENF